MALAHESRNIHMFFNSDTLYISSIFTDLFQDGSGLRGWHLNSAPNFFPEMPVYMLLMWIFKGTALTSFIYSIIQFTAVMWLTQRLIKIADPDTRIETFILINALYLLLMLSPVSGEDLVFPFQLLISGYHAGYFVNVLLALIAAFSFVKTGRPLPLVLMGLVVMLAALSDKFFLVGFTVPVLIISALSTIHKDLRFRYALLFAVVLISSYIGLRIFRWLDEGQILHFFGTRGKMFAFDNMAVSFGNLFRHMKEIIVEYPLQRLLVVFALIFVLGAPVYLLGQAGKFLRGGLDALQKRHFVFVAFLFIFSVAIFITPALNGYYLGAAHIRYNYPALVLGSVGFIYLLSHLLEDSRLFATITQYLAMGLVGIILATIVVLGIKNDIGKGVTSFVNHYPDKSKILDHLKESHDLKYGIAGYWHAKYATTFSKNKVRVYAVHDVDLKPYLHVINRNWYHDGGKGVHADPVFNFLYGDVGYDTNGRLKAVFGERLDTIYLQDGAMVIKLPDFKIDRKTREMIPLDQLWISD
jgi:hypothetical protein